VSTDLKLLFNTTYVADIRDPQSFARQYFTKGKYPEAAFECPSYPIVFWKAWPQYGIGKALIEGSMGDLWMPGARDRIKTVCMAGHLGLMLICSQKFLLESAVNTTYQNQHLETFYTYLNQMRNLAAADQLAGCLSQEAHFLNAADVVKYAEEYIGKESDGLQPRARYINGKIDPLGMVYPYVAPEITRNQMMPRRRECMPYKDPTCWKRKSLLLRDTCEFCCSAFEHKTGQGSDWCFDHQWTYERCCNNDFQGLVCSEERKGEEGGCVDCKKSVIYRCLSPPEHHLHEAQKKL